MKPQATSMVKFCYAMLAINMALALGFWVAKDREHTVMFMAGSILWIVASLIWIRNANHGD